MADRKFFRTTFRGFSKADVLEHIDTLRAQQQEELKDMQAQCDAARAEAAAVAALPAEQLAELEELRVKVPAYEQEIAQLKQQLEESNQTLSALWQQQNHLQSCITEAEDFTADVQALTVQLAARVEAYAGKPEVTETAEPMEQEPAEEKPSSASKNEMADWLY